MGHKPLKMEVWTLSTLLVTGLQFCFKGALAEDGWSVWWSYEQFTGPDYWAINNEWVRCSNGKHQSPVNVDPKSLLFDPKLKSLKVDSARVSAEMLNTGQDLTVYINGSNIANITAGPLSYKYKVDRIKFHFGKLHDEGSEHVIANKSFPAEMQIYAYNTDLYKNFQQASKHSQGLVAIALFIEVGVKPNRELATISKEFVNVRYKNWTVNISGLSISNLLPETEGYITYEGSLTQPGCYETVTWIIMNKPIYISQKHETSTETEIEEMDKLVWPRVVCLGSSIMTARNYMVVADGCVVLQDLGGCLSAITSLFAIFYVLNIHYQEGAMSTLEFIQRCFVGLNPDRGSKTDKKRKSTAGGGVNAKVLRLINKISNYEWTSV